MTLDFTDSPVGALAGIREPVQASSGETLALPERVKMSRRTARWSISSMKGKMTWNLILQGPPRSHFHEHGTFRYSSRAARTCP